MKKSLSFDDVLLEPKYSDIESRSHIDISNYLDEYTYLRTPVVSSPMDTVTETEMATAVSKAGGIGVIHRYNTIEEQVILAKKTKGTLLLQLVLLVITKRALLLWSKPDAACFA